MMVSDPLPVGLYALVAADFWLKRSAARERTYAMLDCGTETSEYTTNVR